jgi:hypothetical protein
MSGEAVAAAGVTAAAPVAGSDDPDLEEEAMEKLQAYIRELGGQLDDGWALVCLSVCLFVCLFPLRTKHAFD